MNKYVNSIRQRLTYAWRHQGNHVMYLAMLLAMGIAVAALTQAPARLAAQQATNVANDATTGTAQFALATMAMQANDPVTAASIAQPNEDIVPDPELCGANGYRIEGTELCTHEKADPQPSDDELEYAELALDNVSIPKTTLCIGDGQSGKRVQVMYVRASDRSDRYEESLNTIRTIASNVGLLFEASADATGGNLFINYVFTPECETDVLNVEIPASDDDTFAATTRALNTLGYNSPDRKYLIFMESDVYCGIATIISDSQPGSENKSNHKTGYARIDRKCWNETAAAHELTHTLGGIQHDAPHSTGGWHCTDDYDVMCYSDDPYQPDVSVLCNDERYENLLDCGSDDYFHSKPEAGSYLATHWNVANSQFLLNYDQYTAVADVWLEVTPDTSNGSAPDSYLVKMNFTGAGSDKVIAATDRVEFYVDDQLLGVSHDGIFETTWQPSAPGKYLVEGRLYGITGGRYFQELRINVRDTVYLPLILKN